MRLVLLALSILAALALDVSADQGVLRKFGIRRAPVASGAVPCGDCFFETSFSVAQGWLTDYIDTPSPCSGAGLNNKQAGVSLSGGRATPGNHCASVLAAANRAAGVADTRAFRMYVWDGSNQYTEGLRLHFGSMPGFSGVVGGGGEERTSHYFGTFHVRYSPDAAIAASSGSHKWAYHALGFCGTHQNGCYLLWDGIDALKFHTGDNNNDHPVPSASFGFQSLNGGVNAGDNTFHCIQYEIQIESSGAAADGVVKIYADGVLKASDTDVDTNSFGDSGIAGVYLPHNGVWDVVASDAYIDIDDIKLSTVSLPAC